MQTGVVKNCHDKMLFDVVNRFVGLSQEEKNIIDTVVEKAWERCMYSFSHINNRRYNTGGIQIYHICQYSMFLYFVANEIYRTYTLGGQTVRWLGLYVIKYSWLILLLLVRIFIMNKQC